MRELKRPESLLPRNDEVDLEPLLIAKGVKLPSSAGVRLDLGDLGGHEPFEKRSQERGPFD
jgi:hypothetical protein